MFVNVVPWDLESFTCNFSAQAVIYPPEESRTTGQKIAFSVLTSVVELHFFSVQERFDPAR